MKKITALLLVLLLCLSSALPAFAAAETDADTQAFREIDGIPYVCLDTLVTDAAIRITHTNHEIHLSEDGLDIMLATDSQFVFRDGYRIAAMKAAPQIIDEQVYVSADFYEDFLCPNDADQPSLFHSTPFFASEVLAALEHPQSSVFHQKLLSAISLPVSMDITEPHIDMGKVFVETALSEYPSVFAEELKTLGYADADTFAYSEYDIISGTRSLTEAGMTFVLDSYPELGDIDPDDMTVAEFRDWQRRHAQQQMELSETEKAFIKEKKIEPRDLTYLNRVFYGAYMEQSDASLKAVLEEYYAVDIQALRDMRNPFTDVSTEDWYYDAVVYAYENGLMTGTDTATGIFSPNSTTTRAQIVTILHRLEGTPDLPNDYDVPSFSDVNGNTSAQYFDAVRWAAYEGIVEGSRGKFNPGSPITREQLATILWRYAKYKGYDVSAGEDTNILSYKDAFSVSEYAYAPLQWACGASILQGDDGYLMPQGNAARCEVAVMLQRFCETVVNT